MRKRDGGINKKRKRQREKKRKRALHREYLSYLSHLSHLILIGLHRSSPQDVSRDGHRHLRKGDHATGRLALRGRPRTQPEV